jgi:transketolase
MRTSFSSALAEHSSNKDFIFLTGDLGYGALEGLRDQLKDRFINAGVAEQNMIGVAAGLSRVGFRPWAYSIAPFLYARAFEQIRNDICLHNLPVVIVGNGGGYGYGVMGPTHHALEDYGVLLTLQKIHAMIPTFDSDVPQIVKFLMKTDRPAYLRLGRDEAPSSYNRPSFKPFRLLFPPLDNTLIVAVGPIASTLVSPLIQNREKYRSGLYAVSELPCTRNWFSDEVLRTFSGINSITVAEEHCLQGGLALHLGHILNTLGLGHIRITACTAHGYPSGTYGSQDFHRTQSGLASHQILDITKDNGSR